MAVVKPQSPIINWGDPVTQGLVFDAPLAEGAGLKARNLVDGTEGALTNAPTWVTKLNGKGVDFSGASSTKNITYTTKAPLNSLTKCSVELVFNWPSSRSDGQTMFLKGTDAQRYFHVGEVNAGLGLVILVVAWSGGNAAWAIAAPSVGDHHLIVTYDGGSTSNDPIGYLDGIPRSLTFDLNSSGTRSADNTALYIGNREATGNGWNSHIYLARMWNRILTPTEVWNQYQNPWRIYQKPKYKILNSIASGVAQATNAIWHGINF